ncbi:MbtH family protein [Streptomyces sp. YKOK-I1]
MSTHPFDDPAAVYHVLVNDEGQHSLWPAFADVPAGWTVALREAGREACLEHVNTHWTDMRPRTLRDRTA